MFNVNCNNKYKKRQQILKHSEFRWERKKWMNKKRITSTATSESTREEGEKKKTNQADISTNCSRSKFVYADADADWDGAKKK